MKVRKYIDNCKKEFDRIDINLIISYDCNAKCKFCFQYLNKQQHDVINVKLVIDILQYIITKKMKPFVHITGGEPVIHIHELTELIIYLHKNNISYDIFTNGTLINNKYKNIIDYANTIHISIHGFNIYEMRDKLNYISYNKPNFNIINNNVILHVNFLPSKYKDLLQMLEKLQKFIGYRLLKHVSIIEIPYDVNIGETSDNDWNSIVDGYIFQCSNLHNLPNDIILYDINFKLRNNKQVIIRFNNYNANKGCDVYSNLIIYPNNNITTYTENGEELLLL